ncbi:hypothetical protein K431DRAFT_281190 [Polychaeton citri CBS 116435]|uniref:Uncharacterized protein n=1 Tax=Polychaeton citri CBS 116435 TaxID=1314669 RepID=A0A9P4QFE2_9PEZI|nr:hypothetical protein K431DRAFT_281190 [Polychaeton citri CBS 116435]
MDIATTLCLSSSHRVVILVAQPTLALCQHATSGIPPMGIVSKQASQRCRSVQYHRRQRPNSPTWLAEGVTYCSNLCKGPCFLLLFASELEAIQRLVASGPVVGTKRPKHSKVRVLAVRMRPCAAKGSRVWPAYQQATVASWRPV